MEKLKNNRLLNIYGIYVTIAKDGFITYKRENMPNNTHTKILATLGPSSNSEEKISDLVDAGVDGFRLNFSHGTHEEHQQMYDIIRRVAKKKNAHITVVADMQGPKLRIGMFKDGKVLLNKGQKFTLDMKDELGDETRVTLPHKEIFEALKVGDILLVNDGNIVLNVIERDNDSAVTEVVVGGIVSGHKGVNLPNSSLNISPLTPKDHEDLQFVLKLGVDCICLSFVQRAEDIKEARKIIGKKAWIISKLEKPQVLDDLDGIVKASDMVMVARGDLGVECPIVTVPVLQKRIEAKCRLYGKPVIVATQMLESMISAPMPTRAEVSDVANAVYDGCDVVMLSAETAAGSYPVETVKTMHGVIEQVEADPKYFESVNRFVEGFYCNSEAHAITHAASEVVKTLSKVCCITTFSVSGNTTLSMAQERPILPIVSVNPSEEIARRLNLVWGVKTYIDKKVFESFDNIETVSRGFARIAGLADKGGYIVVTAGYPFGKVGSTNVLHIVKA